jgi:3-hydroxy-9,10-secoandrosta-1,3,5(10)-triene-9,17-dione monooxygenase
MPAPSRTFPVVAPPASLTAEEAIAAARRLRPRLLAEAAETEERTFYSEGLHLEFLGTGLYNLLRPTRYGGYELGLETWSAVVRELARGDMGTAWSFCLASIHVLWMASWWPQAAQDEIFAEPHAIASGTFAPGGTMVRVDGGWRVDAAFAYSSGSPYSTHAIGHVFEVDDDGRRGRLNVVLVPRSGWTLRDDWGRTLGLKGSGSHTVEIDGAIIPDRYVLQGTNISEMSIEGGTPGWHLHGNPLYNIRGTGLFSIELGSLALGAARAALDEYEAVLRTKTVALPPPRLRGEDPTYLRWLADASTEITGGEARMDAAIALLAEYSARSALGTGPYSPADDLHFGRLAFSGQIAAWRAVEGILIRTIGSSGLVSGTRTERIWRDMSMLHGHQNVVLQDIIAPLYGAGVLGSAD